MIVVDANILLYATDAQSPRHEPARRWLEDALNGKDEIGFPLVSLLAFVRLSSSIQQGYGDPGFVRALRVALAIAIASSMFLSEQYFLPFWLLGGLASAIWVDGRRRQAEQDRLRTPGRR